MPEYYKVLIFANHRSLKPMHETLIAARTRSEANRMARDAAQAVGGSYFRVEA
jgi:hypothetical protein